MSALLSASDGSRWEWRIFSNSPLDQLRPLFGKLRRANHKKDRDIYIISRFTGANLKVRGAAMDIKIKLEDSTLGAERWKPVFKTPFPPALSAFSAITGYMGAPMHVSLADGVLPRGAHIATVEAEKERDIYMVKDAIIEYGSVSFGKRRMWSLCAESAELSQVEYFISGCRIKNVMTASYVTMLKHFLNW